MKKLKVGLVCFVAFFGILTPKFANAETFVINSPISSDTTWSAPNIYIIDNGFSVPAGLTLTINPGTIIKVKAMPYGGGPNIYGKIVARGTVASPIYFTSFWNDSIGGDTDGYPSTEVSNRWQGLYFRPGSEGIFDYVDISYAGYGGYGYGDYVGIENDGGDLNIQHSNIHDNFLITSNGAGGSMSIGSGIYNKSGVLSVSDSVTNNNVVGIRIDSGTTTISNTTFKNNVDSTGYGSGYSLYAYGSEPLTLLNNTFSGNNKTANINTSKNFIHNGNASNDLKNRGFEMNGTISDNTTLSAGDLPYIIGSITVNAGKTLIIEPGAILKMNDYYSTGAIYVRSGNLIAKGTKDLPIYITSLKDDSVGGDTNGDGNATIPAPKNWASIFLESGSKAEFENVTVSYGGYNWNGEYLNIAAVIYQRGAEFKIANSVFEYNSGADIYQDAGSTTINRSKLANGNLGIWSRGGSVAISQSSILNHTSYGIYNQSDLDLGWWWQTKPLQIIDARNNWWGSVNGPKDLSTSTPTGTGDGISENVLFEPFLITPPSDLSTGSGQINPVIIIPGIMGSAYKNGQLIIDPILHTYDDLMATLEANGYEKNKNLFAFPYEWRDSNVITADLLKQKISAVKTACLSAQAISSSTLGIIDCSKVDLVVHSMGGLVARQYIQSNSYQSDVDQLIFLGTPHRGAPKSYLQWEGGEFYPNDWLVGLMKLKFSLEAIQNFYPSLFNYIHNRPISSVQELLPIFDYIKDKDTEIVRTYPNNYPRNIFLESLNTKTGISKLLNSGIKITNIVGNTGTSTIDIIRVASSSDFLWIDGKPYNFDNKNSDQGLEKGTGDGTVTIFGATLDDSIKNVISSADHQQLPSAEEEKVFNILTGKTIENGVHRSLIRKLFTIQLHSPIDVVITAPDGKKIGKNFSDGTEYNEISDAFYSGYQTDNEYITIPNPLDGEYKIEVQGTENGGEYGIETNYITDNNSVSNLYSNTIKTGEIKDLSLTLNSIDQTIQFIPEIKPETKTEEIIVAQNNSGSSSGSRHIIPEVLGASTTPNELTDEQKIIMKKIIVILGDIIKLYKIYLLNNN